MVGCNIAGFTNTAANTINCGAAGKSTHIMLKIIANPNIMTLTDKDTSTNTTGFTDEEKNLMKGIEVMGSNTNTTGEGMKFMN